MTVLVHDEDDGFEIPAYLEDELQASLAEAVRGEILPVAEVLRRLRAG